MIIDTQEGISMFRLLSLRGMIRMELAGMKGRGKPTIQVIKELDGRTITRQTRKERERAIELLNAKIEEIKANR